LDICKLEYSPNNEYLFVDTGTSIARNGVIVNLKKGKVIGTLRYLTMFWSPDSKYIGIEVDSSNIKIPDFSWDSFQQRNVYLLYRTHVK
jgi:hypothetical protein